MWCVGAGAATGAAPSATTAATTARSATADSYRLVTGEAADAGAGAGDGSGGYRSSGNQNTDRLPGHQGAWVSLRKPADPQGGQPCSVQSHGAESRGGKEGVTGGLQQSPQRREGGSAERSAAVFRSPYFTEPRRGGMSGREREKGDGCNSFVHDIGRDEDGQQQQQQQQEQPQGVGCERGGGGMSRGKGEAGGKEVADCIELEEGGKGEEEGEGVEVIALDSASSSPEDFMHPPPTVKEANTREKSSHAASASARASASAADAERDPSNGEQQCEKMAGRAREGGHVRVGRVNCEYETEGMSHQTAEEVAAGMKRKELMGGIEESLFGTYAFTKKYK